MCRTRRHFDRSEVSGEIFGNAIFVSKFKDFSATLEMTDDLRNYIYSDKKHLKIFNFYY